MEEEPGCIHYYTSQTDCRKGKEDNLSLLHMKRLPYIVAQNSLLCGAILIHLTSNICHCSYQLHLTTLVGLPLAISPHLQPLSTSPIFQPLEDWKIREAERGCSLNSSSCLNDARKISFPAKQLVLPPLCKDTPLQPFILHLAFYCEREFPSVVQDEGLKRRALT